MTQRSSYQISLFQAHKGHTHSVSADGEDVEGGVDGEVAKLKDGDLKQGASKKSAVKAPPSGGGGEHGDDVGGVCVVCVCGYNHFIVSSRFPLESCLCTRASTPLSTAWGPSPTLPPTSVCGPWDWPISVCLLHTCMHLYSCCVCVCACVCTFRTCRGAVDHGTEQSHRPSCSWWWSWCGSRLCAVGILGRYDWVFGLDVGLADQCWINFTSHSSTDGQHSSHYGRAVCIPPCTSLALV